MENIENIKAEIKYLRHLESDILMQLALCRKNMKLAEERLELADIEKINASKKLRAIKTASTDSAKQNAVVMSLRKIGKPTTARLICLELARLGRKLPHHSNFASYYLDAIKKDGRIVVTPVNASKNTYSLKEWDYRK